MDKSLRWIAVVPSAMLAWCIAFVVSLYALGMAERFLCPADLLSSSGCYTPWWSSVEQSAAALGAALAAFLVVLVATFVAPSHRRRVAWYSYAVGAFFAVLIGFWTHFLVEMATTLLAGAVTAAVISRKLKA